MGMGFWFRLSNDAKNESSLLYTRRRDIHSVGIVFLQMLLGLDVMQRFDDVHEALQNCTLFFPPPLSVPTNNLTSRYLFP